MQYITMMIDLHKELKSTRNGVYEGYYKIYFSCLMALKDN